METYYKILGISDSASSTEIKRAFRQLAFKYHPDCNLENKKESHGKMTRINQAYAVLIDPVSRSAYDKVLLSQRGSTYGPGNTEGASESNPPKESFFNRNWQFVFYGFLIIIKLLSRDNSFSVQNTNKVPAYYQTTLMGNQSIRQILDLEKDYQIESMYIKK